MSTPATLRSDTRKTQTPAVEPPALRHPPHNIEAEQALLGAILVNNEAMDRVSGFLEPHHFFDPLHGQIYEVTAKLIHAGKQATPITLRTFFENAEPIDERTTVPQYLGRLAVNATTIVNAADYGRTIYDLATRRALITIGEEMVITAYDSPVDHPPRSQIEEAEGRLYTLAESGKYGQGFLTFSTALTQAIEMANSAYQRDGHLSGLATGLTDLDAKLGGLQNSDLIILAGRPSMGKTSISTNIAYNIARAHRTEKQSDGSDKVVDGAVVGFFSLEMSAEQLATRVLSEQAEIASEKIRRGMIGEEEFRRLVQVSQEMSRLPLYIDQTGGISIAQLAARARKLKRQKGLGLLVVDYLQLITGSTRRASEGRVQEVSEITTGLKALAKELNIPVLALSQLSRQVEQRDDKRPQLSDLRESGCLTGDSLITMADSGLRVPICDLVGKAGFRVWALDEQTLKIEGAAVSRAFATGRRPVFRIETRLGRAIRATGNHKFRALLNWRRLDELQLGDHIALPRQIAGLGSSDPTWDEIISIMPDGDEEVYDLTVPGPSNFVANDIVVHNSIEQDSDVVMFVFREEYYVERRKPAEGSPEFAAWQTDMDRVHGKAEVIIGKQRHGPTGTVPLQFEAKFTRFSNLARDDQAAERYR